MDGGVELPPCNWPEELRDATGCYPFAKFLELKDCTLPPPKPGDREVCFGMAFEVRDKHGHKLDGDYDPAGAHGCDHRETPEWKAEHSPKKTTKEKPMDPVKEEVPPMLALNDPPPAAPTVPTVGVDAAIGQVKSLVPADTSPGLLIGGAATLAVIGAAIKFGPSMMKAKAEKAERQHELELKKLEMEKERQSKQEDQHQKCSVERMALEARLSTTQSQAEAAVRELSAVKAQLEEVQRRQESAKSVDLGDFDPEELEERLAKLEKLTKPAGKPGPKKKV